MGGGPDLDMWLEKIRACEVLAEDELKLLCEYVCSRDQAMISVTDLADHKVIQDAGY